MSKYSKKNLLFVISGSISAFKACSLISLMRKSGQYNIRTMTTRSALKFVGESSLEGLTGEKNFSDLWEPGYAMEHIELGKWADEMLVYPASGNLINRFAAGIAEDLVSNVFLAWPHEKPILMAPAMNTKMLEHFTVRKSMQTLKENGIRFVEPGHGELACGEVGIGRLAEPEDVLLQLQSADLKSKRALVIYGGTRVPIDAVRSITNTSSGKTGKVIVEELSTLGFEVHSVRSENSPVSKSSSLDSVFDTYDDLVDQLENILKQINYDLVVNLAAISDFAVARVEGAQDPSGPKLSSHGELKIVLKQTEKVLPKIKLWARNDPVVVGFKLLVGSSRSDFKKAVEKVFETGGVDYVVANDLEKIGQNHHRFDLHRDSEIVESGGTRQEMAEAISRVAEVSL